MELSGGFKREEASIDPAKLKDYALDPDHEKGRHKAVVFAATLGIRQGDWEHLRDEIMREIATAPLRRSGQTVGTGVRGQDGSRGPQRKDATGRHGLVLRRRRRPTIANYGVRGYAMTRPWRTALACGNPRAVRLYDGGTKHPSTQRGGSRNGTATRCRRAERWLRSMEGTRGTVVEVLDPGVLVEITDEHGHTLDVVSMPHDLVRVVDRPQQARLLV